MMMFRKRLLKKPRFELLLHRAEFSGRLGGLIPT